MSRCKSVELDKEELADLKNANSLSKSAKPEDVIKEATKMVVESDNKPA